MKRLISTILCMCITFTFITGIVSAAPVNPFTDVAKGTYYHDAVIWAVDNGVTSGTSETTFSPNMSCDRGQVVTFLWRASGKPEPKSNANPFNDVKSSDYFYKPVLWAVEQKITSGTSESQFSPEKNCTGGEIITFLYRANGSPKVADTGAKEFYANAVTWATSNGLLDNIEKFDASAKSPRSAIVTYLYRNAGAPRAEVKEEEINSLPTIRRVSSEGGAPFRLKADGDIIGNIPNGSELKVLSYDKESYAKVVYRGQEVFVWADKLSGEIKTPSVVCSPWAKADITDIYEYKRYIVTKDQYNEATQNDLTISLTREEMAKQLVGLMIKEYGSWAVSQTLPIVTGQNGELQAQVEKIGYEPGRLLYWGVATTDYLAPENLNKTVSYDEMCNYLIKLLQYDSANNRGADEYTFTRANIDSFGIGANVSSNAICTIEQAMVMCYKAFGCLAINEVNHSDGINRVRTGIYTIKTYLGDKDAHPYVVINSDGKAELQSARSQKFKITYMGRDYTDFKYTIQTEDGKYLGVEGMPKNGSRIKLTDKPHIWYLNTGRQGFIYSTVFPCQAFNVSGWGTKDGTSIITYTWNGGTGTKENNFAFYFELAE